MGSGASKRNSAGVSVKSKVDREDVQEAAKLATGELSGEDLSSRVELSISCRDLRRRVNCRCVVLMKVGTEAWKEVGRTETCYDTSSPSFIESVFVDYFFEQQQRLRFELYSVVSSSSKSEWQPHPSDLIGSMESKVAEIVAARERQISRSLELPGRATGNGMMSVLGEEMQRVKQQISFEMRIDKLSKRGIFSLKQRQFFVVIFRALSDPKKDPISIYKSELSLNGSPTFKRVTIPINTLCRGEGSRIVRFEVREGNMSGESEIVGFSETCLDEIESACKSKADVKMSIRPIDSKEDLNRSLGELSLVRVEIVRRVSFLDYVENGMEISLLVGIDFTKSNGDPSLPSSLHFFNTTTPNDYVLAIRAVGEILQYYDSDKKYPVYGFGARLPPSLSHCSHCFALNGNIFDPEVSGVPGIIEAYRTALQAVSLHGPTNFHDIIDVACHWAEGTASTIETTQLKYYLLLIITDGVINDMQAALNAVVRASRLPISIVIVGVGKEDFALMEVLDGDKEPLYSTAEKKYAERDIVQFVPFNEFREKSYQELAAATLDEIPREVVNYFHRKGISPEHIKSSDASNFLHQEKSKFIAEAISKGLSQDDVQRVLSEGLPSADLTYLQDVLKNTPIGSGGPFACAPSPHVMRRASTQGLTVKVAASGGWGSGQATPGGKAPMSPTLSSQQQSGSEGESEPKKKKIPGPVILDESLICKVCFERVIDVVLLPCGHVTVCEQCSTTLGDVCPMCRAKISLVVKTYGT